MLQQLPSWPQLPQLRRQTLRHDEFHDAIRTAVCFPCLPCLDVLLAALPARKCFDTRRYLLRTEPYRGVAADSPDMLTQTGSIFGRSMPLCRPRASFLPAPYLRRSRGQRFPEGLQTPPKKSDMLPLFLYAATAPSAWLRNPISEAEDVLQPDDVAKFDAFVAASQGFSVQVSAASQA